MSDVALEESYRICSTTARRAAGNFYYSFWALPAAKRRSMCALYAFFRRTDDLGDDAGSVDERGAALTRWRGSLMNAAAGKFDDPLFPALLDTIHRYEIPLEYFETAIDGVETDLARTEFATLAELEGYCYQVASVVGLACIHVWGFHREPSAYEAAHHCGTAFQLTNIVRDVKEDAERGRVYLPRQLLLQHGISPQSLIDGHFDAVVCDVIRSVAYHAEEHYASARRLTPYLSADGRRAYGAMLAIYHGLLKRIHAANYDVFTTRIRLPAWRKTAIALQHMWPRFVPQFGARGPRPTIDSLSDHS